MRTLIFFFILMLLAGCQTSEQTIEPGSGMITDDDIPTIHGTWELREISEVEVELNWFREQLPHIQFDLSEGRFGGFGGCNQIGGDFSIENQFIDLYNITATRMHCGDENREPEFLNLLNDVEYHGVDDERLLLTTEDESSLLFHRVAD